jgi:hypothetical protein
MEPSSLAPARAAALPAGGPESISAVLGELAEIASETLDQGLRACRDRD